MVPPPPKGGGGREGRYKDRSLFHFDLFIFACKCHMSPVCVCGSAAGLYRVLCGFCRSMSLYRKFGWPGGGRGQASRVWAS